MSDSMRPSVSSVPPVLAATRRGPQPATGRAHNQPGHAREVLLAVADVGQELGSSNDLNQRLLGALRALDRRLGASRCALITASGEESRFQVRAIHGLSSDDYRPQLTRGVAGRVLASGQPIVVPVLRHDPMALSELSELERWNEVGWNLVAVPVANAGQATGVLSAYFKQRDPCGFAGRLNAMDTAAALMASALRGEHYSAASDTTPSLAVGPDVPDVIDEAPLAARAEPAAQSPFEYANMVGESAVMRQIYEQIGQVARTNATVLLRGESGTGKEVVAQAIHQNSPRAEHPFVKVNCAALPDALFESELFGHERGAFTGAHARKKGRFELAQGGTLFLDEIGELTATAQAKLLRVLQFREFERVGGTETVRSDVRIIAATNLDLERAVAAGNFREDLYYRIHVFTITLPPLRARRADVPALAQYFLRKWALEHKRSKITRVGSGALDLLCDHAWPGNVRELENVLERAVVVCTGPIINEQHLPQNLRTPAPKTERLTLNEAVEKLERHMITEALDSAAGNMAAVARALGTTERVIRYKALKLGIAPGRPRR